jgi:hypothetical protein
MSKYIVVGLLLLIIIALVIWNSNKNKRGTIVLGKEIADASEKERQRIEAGKFMQSPLSTFDYSRWSNEQSLINPIENELDFRIIELCEEFKNYNEAKRNKIRQSISQNEIYTLLEFTKRATLLGVRKKEPYYIHNGFVAVSMIETERCDYRDVLVTLSFLNYGLKKLNLNASTVFKEAIQLSEENTRKLINEFAERPPNNKSLETMGGYTAIETANGISFIQTNYEKYNPEKNLAKILFDISDYISGDKYFKGQITVGEKVASIWLGADNDNRIEEVISKASGCATLSTDLRNEFHPKSDVQMLLIYLAEFKDNKSLKVLTEQVNANVPTTFSRLSFVEDDVFCVVIQRAIMVDVDEFETNKSLKRFELPLRELIRKN